jgi:DNA-binding response OmpR family regulator
MGPVLQVEDEEFDVLLLGKAFAKAGAGRTLVSVPDGQQAILYLSGEGVYADRVNYPEPSLLLLDLNLLLVNGFEVLAWIQQQSYWRGSLPVIVLTSSCQESDRKKVFELGAREFLVKPSRFEELVTLVEHLRRRWLEPIEGAGVVQPSAPGIESKRPG